MSALESSRWIAISWWLEILPACYNRVSILWEMPAIERSSSLPVILPLESRLRLSQSICGFELISLERHCRYLCQKTSCRWMCTITACSMFPSLFLSIAPSHLPLLSISLAESTQSRNSNYQSINRIRQCWQKYLCKTKSKVEGNEICSYFVKYTCTCHSRSTRAANETVRLCT